MDATGDPATMVCSRHGEIAEPLDGRCPKCLKEDLMNYLTDLAAKGGSLALDPADRPLSYLPELDVWPRDFPWLNSGEMDDARVAVIRRLFSEAFVISAHAAVEADHPVRALVLLGGAVNFRPQDPSLSARIHLEAAHALHTILRGRGEFDRARMTQGGVRSLASVACHVEVALRHIAEARTKGTEGRKAASRKTVAVESLAARAHQFRADILARGYFEIQGDQLIGRDLVETAEITSFLFPSVPWKAED